MNKIRLGTPVVSSSGEEAGEVDRIVLDPESGEVTHIAVRCKGLLTRDIVVPISTVARWDAREVQLDRRVVHLEAMPEYREEAYVSPSEEQLPSSIYQHGEVLFPVALVGPVASLERDFRVGKEVECNDGVCGVLALVLVDPVSQRVVSFLMKHAGTLSRDVVVPVEWVLDAKGDRVRLDCNVRQLEEVLRPAAVLGRAVGE